MTAWNGETFQWDARGRLKQFQKTGTTITFTYDSFQEPVGQVLGRQTVNAQQQPIGVF
jgi:YD repeat-containing protein